MNTKKKTRDAGKAVADGIDRKREVEEIEKMVSAKKAKREAAALPAVIEKEPRNVLMVSTEQQETSAEALIALAIREKLPVENLERLMKMRTEFRAEQAREMYFRALAQFQKECPPVPKTKTVYNKDGKTIRYKYAPLDVIVATVKDALTKNGFSYRFETVPEPNALLIHCILTHEMGHSEKSEMKVPIDSEAYMNAPQKQGSAITFGKRYTFVNATGILTADEDDDAQEGGAPPERQPQGQQQATAQAAPAAPREVGPAAPFKKTVHLADVQIQKNADRLTSVLRVVPLSDQNKAKLEAQTKEYLSSDYETILRRLMNEYYVYQTETRKVYNDEKVIVQILKELKAADFMALDVTNAIIALEALNAHFMKPKPTPTNPAGDQDDADDLPGNVNPPVVDR